MSDPLEPAPAPMSAPISAEFAVPPPPPLKPPPKPNWVRRFIVEYNPFFLLSAMSMLAGSLALTNSLSWSPVPLQRILALTFAVNVYEVLLVGLGLFLIQRRSGRRDGSILLILEAFFLVDVAFLNAEIFAIDPWVGLWMNLIVFAIAIAKLSAIFYVLRIPLSSPLVTLVLVELLALFALPGVLKLQTSLAGGQLPPIVMWAAWWMIFAMGVLVVGALKSHSPQGKLAWFTPLLAILTGVSLIAHAATGQWVYDLKYWGADLAPMLALASFILLPIRIVRPLGFVCAMAAVFASLNHGWPHLIRVWDHSLSPTHVTSIAVYLVLAWTLARNLFLWFASAGALAALLAVFGPSLASIKLWIETVYDFTARWIEAMRPKSQTHWGIIGVVMSFVFLAIGAVVSIRRDALPQEQRG